jgi:hypothetical protein
MRHFLATYWPGLVALILAALYIDWSRPENPDDYIDPEKERSAHLLGRRH